MLITNYSFRLLALLTFSLLFVACEKDDEGDPDNESELITTVTLTFVNTTTGQTATASYSDPDGPGGTAPTAQGITLKANTIYDLTVKFLDASNPSDIKDITEEVEGENTAHLVCFNVSGAMPKPAALNTDDQGKTLGTKGKVTTTGAGSGTLSIVLKHMPDKGAADPCFTGETDVETAPAFAVTVAN